MPEPEDRPPVEPAAPVAAERLSGRGRLRAAMVRPSRGQAVVGVLLAGLGFAAVTQVRATEVDSTYANYREQDLIDVLDTMTVATQRAQSELAQLEQTRRDLRSDTRRRAAALAQAQQDADTLGILSGQVPVTGPGIRITVTETDGAVDVNSMLDTVQELRTAGAEAMELNDEVRIVGSTSFAEGVGGLVVDDTLVTSPFTLEVIGDPATLEAAMVFPQGPSDQFEEDGATVTIEQVSGLLIESVHTADRPEYAEPAPTQ